MFPWLLACYHVYRELERLVATTSRQVATVDDFFDVSTALANIGEEDRSDSRWAATIPPAFVMSSSLVLP